MSIHKKISHLKLLILFGSRARGDNCDRSDWDFAVLYDNKAPDSETVSWFEIPGILGEVFNINSDAIDLLDLNHCSPLAKHLVALEGKLIYESEPGQFEQFKQQSIMSDREMKTLKHQLRSQIDSFLQEWGVT